MARIEVEAEMAELEGDHGTVDGILAECPVCGHAVEVFGTGEASLKRAGATLAEECPNSANNFYVVEL